MIGNPTRPGDLAMTINCDPMSGWMVRVIHARGDKREVKHVGKAVHPVTGRVYKDGFVVKDFPDKFLQPIRPPAPEEKDERAEHLVGVV